MKYLFSILFIILVVVAAGLLTFYQTSYRTTPLSSSVSAAPPIRMTVPSPGKPVLVPVPRQLVWDAGSFSLREAMEFASPPEDSAAIRKTLEIRLNSKWIFKKEGSVKFKRDRSLADQAYRLKVHPHQIIVEYGNLEGMNYAISTLKQLAFQSNGLLPCVQIADHPDLKVRGAMLDISRGKIPTLQTLFGMVDFLADLKYNQLQLYVEGFSFGYPSFKDLWEKTETPLLPEEIRQLDAYCRDRFIELVPNQNSLGHMDAWLRTDQFKNLAECPEGFKLLGLIEMKSTISPSNPASLELVKKMSEDLMPNFQSTQFNVNLDEPFELGKNKDHPVSDSKEIAEIYLAYAGKLNGYLNNKDRKMMMWGDVVSRNPDIIAKIPKNITLLEWRYESMQPFVSICSKYQQAGLKYLVCPGTSSWSSFTGRTDNMMGNVENAVSAAIRYGAAGMLVTDWGDTPHLQYLTVSYAGLAYAAALSWYNLPRESIPLIGYLDRVVFRDKSHKMGSLVMELGRYNQFEEFPMVAMTTTSMAFRFGLMDKLLLNTIDQKLHTGLLELLSSEAEVKQELTNRFNNARPYDSRAIVQYVDSLEHQLVQIKLEIADSSLIKEEYVNAIHMIRLGALIKHYNDFHLQQTDEENRSLLNEMKLLNPKIISEHERLWMKRNKKSGLVTSMDAFVKLQKQIDDKLTLQEKNGFSQWVKRIFEKMGVAAAVLYLN